MTPRFEPIRVFCGYDPREKHGFHVFVDSLIQHASVPVSIIPIFGEQRDGTNAFTYERFFIPYYCKFKGRAIFLDASDMLMRRDILELYALFDDTYAVQVVKHNYQTTQPRKYLGTAMEADNRDYPRKNWSSVVLWNCAHGANSVLTRAHVPTLDGSYLHRFQWLKDEQIGSIPETWNHLVLEQPHKPASLVHYTLGIPHIPAYSDCPYSDEYRAVADSITAPIPERKTDELHSDASLAVCNG